MTTIMLGLVVVTLLLPACAAASSPRLPPRFLPLPPNAARAAGAALEIGTTVGGAYLLREHVMDARYIPTESMVPTLEVGDLLLLDKISLRVRSAARGDVVCFRPPPALVEMQPALGSGDCCMIKRVVAVAGDSVRVRGGRLLVNGKHVEEPYVPERIGYDMGRKSVPAGHVFVLGDNRNYSLDSHMWGCLDEALLIGRPLVRYWPLARFAGGRTFGAGARLSYASQ